MKRKILIILFAISTINFSATKPNGKMVKMITKEKYVSERFKETTNSSQDNINLNEEGDGGIISSEKDKKNIDTTVRTPEMIKQISPRYTTSTTKINSREKLLNNVLNKITSDSYTYLNIPYVWGGTTRRGLDCSAFVKNVYADIGVILPRVSRDQAKVGKSISSLSLARKGDLLFFYTDNKRPNTVTHVGMYLGNNQMIHASSKNKKVIVVDLRNGYFLSRMAGIKRIVDINV